MNIVLIGFMGVGKTTIGKLIAEKMNITFIDTDDLIVKKVGLSIKEIFHKFGEDFFRTVERDVIGELSYKDCSVIAVGGGAILNYRNVAALHKNGRIYYLKASPWILVEHLKNNTSRPLLNTNDINKRVNELLKKRSELYIKSCDVCIDIDFKKPVQVAEEIINDYIERSNK